MVTDKFKIKTIKIDDTVERLVFVSDIHSHIDPLLVVNELLSDYNENTKIACNGDIFHAGPQPVEALDWVMEHAKDLCILGNHDETVLAPQENDDPAYLDTGVSKLLNEQQKDYLKGLPDIIHLEWKNKRIKMIHGHQNYHGENASHMLTPNESAECFHNKDSDMVILGHSHLPSIKNYNNCIVANCGSVSFNWFKYLVDDSNSIVSKNDESAPEPEVGNKVSFLTVTQIDSKLTPEHTYFDYDYQPSLKKMKELNFPAIERLERWYSKSVL